MSGPKTTPTSRVQWLVDRPDRLTGWPGNDHNLKLEMQTAGLISAKTSLNNVDISRLVAQARKLRRAR